jgi:glycerol-3-phosphate acyltransferase PlsY
MTLFWIALAFLAGSLPYSVWLGRLMLNTDIRDYGDGNPGATNAWKAGGWRAGIPALLLDYAKGAVPVGSLHFIAGFSGWALIAAALAPVLGHAFSPFLRFQGGKALAVTFGVWTGLTLAEGSIVLGLLFTLFIAVLKSDSWAVVCGMLAFLVYLVAYHPDWTLLAIWCGNALILVWKSRDELKQGVAFRPWIWRLAGRDR